MVEFRKLLIMILAFLLLLITVLTEVQEHFVMSDMGMLILVMVFVAVVPALGGVGYKWMIAEDEKEEDREKLSVQRTAIVLAISLFIIGLIIVRLIFKYLV